MAKEEAESGEAGKKSSPESKAKTLAMVKMVLILVNVVATMGGAALVYLSTVGYENPIVTDEEVLKALEKERGTRESSPVIYTMEKFTVNLDGNPMRVIQTELNLELLDEQGFEEVVTMGAEARDTIVKIFNSKKFNEIETIQGKLFLKDQIRTGLNQILHQGVVKEIYFSQFVVQ